MLTQKKEVYTKKYEDGKKPVGTAKAIGFDSPSELIAVLQGGPYDQAVLDEVKAAGGDVPSPTELVATLNAQLMTNAANTMRAPYNKPTSNKALEDEVMNRIISDESLLSQYRAVIQDAVARRTFLEGQIEKLKAEKGIED